MTLLLQTIIVNSHLRFNKSLTVSVKGGCATLFFVDPSVKVIGTYNCSVLLLSQQMFPAIKSVADNMFGFQ